MLIVMTFSGDSSWYFYKLFIDGAKFNETFYHMLALSSVNELLEVVKVGNHKIITT